jgi:hypothetical protein
MQYLLQLPSRTSENPQKAKFAEFVFHALGCIGCYKMRGAPMHGIMSAPWEEDSWLI